MEIIKPSPGPDNNYLNRATLLRSLRQIEVEYSTCLFTEIPLSPEMGTRIMENDENIASILFYN